MAYNLDSLKTNTMKRTNLFITISFLFGMVSCVPTDKLIYLQPGTGESTNVFKYEKQEYRLQVNDILDVQIRSMNEEANQLFSLQVQQGQQGMQVGTQNGGDLYYLTGYPVSEDGAITLPFIGDVFVKGLTLEDAKNRIDIEVAKFFKNYFLQVKLGGIRFSTLGEFNRSGKHVILQNQATIYEAIAVSGDLSMLAKRDEIKLIRQYPEGTKIHKINLLDQSIISSPYYFIQPNDVLYAEPMPQKSWGIGITGAQTFGTIVSTLSASLALTLSIISLNQ